MRSVLFSLVQVTFTPAGFGGTVLPYAGDQVRTAEATTVGKRLQMVDSSHWTPAQGKPAPSDMMAPQLVGGPSPTWAGPGILDPTVG